MAAVLAISLTHARPAAATPITWNFVETSCTSYDGGCTDSLPSKIASLTVPDGNFSGSYVVDCSLNCSVSSSGNFSLEWMPFGGMVDVPSSISTWDAICEYGACGEIVDINIESSAGALSVDIFEGLNTGYVDIQGNNLNTTGGYGSDLFAVGCGTFAFCVIGGYWVEAVPEPWSITLLATALLVMALTLKPWRTRSRRRTPD